MLKKKFSHTFESPVLIFLLSIIAVPAFMLFFSGCAASANNASQTVYVDKNFSPAMLEDYGMALLPVMSDKEYSSLAVSYGDGVDGAIFWLKPMMKYISWQTTEKTMKEKGLLKYYSQAESDYITGGTIRWNLMKEISASMGMRYLLLIKLRDTPSVTDTAVIHGEAEILDCGMGAVVWRGAGTAYSPNSKKESVKNKADDPVFEDCTTVASKGLIQEIFAAYIDLHDGISDKQAVGGRGFKPKAP